MEKPEINIETFASIIKVYSAIWYSYYDKKFDVRHSEMIEASSYSEAFSVARSINNSLNLYDYKCVVQKIDLGKIKPF